MQLATMQLFACSMQLATKAITTAIKLATLQQNGRSITCTMCTGKPNSAHCAKYVYSPLRQKTNTNTNTE